MRTRECARRRTFGCAASNEDARGGVRASGRTPPRRARNLETSWTSSRDARWGRKRRWGEVLRNIGEGRLARGRRRRRRRRATVGVRFRVHRSCCVVSYP
jgi:hypothetical protein